MAKRPNTSDAAAPAAAFVPTGKGKPGPAVTITAGTPGVWAGGQFHGPGTRAYPVGWFSSRQVAEMQAMAGLTVEVSDGGA